METKQLTTNQLNSNIMESLIINGDLSKLNQKEKVEYYSHFCQSLGLNPITQPFKLLTLSGKQTLYCGREGASQLNKVHQVSHEILETKEFNGVYIVKAKATTSGGRFTTSTGAVNIDGLKGEALCNALMKAETKAKRRATLDLLGLGILDESEMETIKGAVTEDIGHIEVTELPILTHENFESMVKFINEGKSDVVLKAMPKYRLSDSQRASLELAIRNQPVQ